MLVEELGNPLVNTSLPPDASQTDPSLLHDAIGHLVDVVIDGGSVYSEPSSVIDLTAEAPEIIRVGKGDISLFL